ncbi:MAG: hypothetical protein HRU35_02745 [Rickettsiaceae bacterium]|nr:hypothetical protein [Rickettsiaceae bacterium]
MLCEVKISEEKKEKLSKLILKNLPNKKGEELMRTIADSYRDEGKEKWLSKGIVRGDRTRVIKIATKMLKKKMLLEDIIELTELSKDEVFKIKKHAKI